MERDETDELRGYVLCYFSHLMTDAERTGTAEERARWERRSLVLAEERRRKVPAFQNVPLSYKPPTSEERIAFLDGVVRRILADHKVEVFINRCPECARILRTPQAKICFRCGHSQYP
jgi:hypothetical protein